MSQPNKTQGALGLIGGTFSSLGIIASQSLPPPYNVILSASLPVILGILLWRAPFTMMNHQIKALRTLGDTIKKQLQEVELSQEDRDDLLLILQRANRRMIELQFDLFPQEEPLGKLKQDFQRILAKRAEDNMLSGPRETVRQIGPALDSASSRALRALRPGE